MTNVKFTVADTKGTQSQERNWSRRGSEFRKRYDTHGKSKPTSQERRQAHAQGSRFTLLIQNCNEIFSATASSGPPCSPCKCLGCATRHVQLHSLPGGSGAQSDLEMI